MFLFLPLEKTEAVWDNVGRIWMLCYCLGQTDLQVATSQYKFPTCIQLAFCLAIYLRGLAMTCIDFGWAQIRTQVAASFSLFGHRTQVNASRLKLRASQLYMCISVKSMTACDLRELVIHLATQHKSMQVNSSWVQVNSTCISVKFMTFSDLRELVIHLATHCKSVHKLVLTFINLWVRLASALQPTVYVWDVCVKN